MASAKEIPPGGEGHIIVTIPNLSKGGPIQKSAWVITNDKTNPRFKLRLLADVRTALGAEPGSIDFGKLRLGETASQTVKLFGYAQDQIKVNEVLCNDPNLTVTLNKGELRVALLAQKIGKIDTSIKLDTDYPPKRKIPVLKVSGRVLGPIAVNSSVLEVPHLKEGEVFKKTLTVISESDAFNIIGVRTSREGPRLSVETVEEGHHYRIHIEVLANQPQNQLHITTDHAFQPNLEVRIYGQ